MAETISSMPDGDLLVLAQNLHGLLDPAPTEYGTDAPWTLALATAISSFDSALTQHVQTQALAKANTIFKNESRAALETLVREARTKAKAAKVHEQNLAQMGIPSGSQTAPSNATVPAVSVSTSERLRHTLHWTDAASLDNKRKPRGAMGAEIWVKIDGPPPGSETDCTFLTLDAFTPYMKEYTSAEAGKTAHYMVRWRMRDGSVSAWGETVSATITG
jgi:hypothetical protein